MCPHLESNQRPPHYKCGALPLSYKGFTCIYHITKKMREAGFEPANPKDVGLSDVALTTNRFALHFLFLFIPF